MIADQRHVDLRRLRDVAHRDAVKAMAGEQPLGGNIEDAVLARPAFRLLARLLFAAQNHGGHSRVLPGAPQRARRMPLDLCSTVVEYFLNGR